MAPPPYRPISVHSWWSDSNKPGATISLHPMATRLAKLLYHRQVMGILKRAASSQLSAVDLDAFVPYLESDLLWGSTKVKILKEIQIASQSDFGVQAIIDVKLVPVLVELLQSRHVGLREATHSVLAKVSEHQSSTGYRYRLLCASLVARLSGEKVSVCRAAVRNLTEICKSSPTGAQMAVDADAIPALFLLYFTNELIDDACALLDSITIHPKFIQPVLEAYESLCPEDLPTFHVTLELDLFRLCRERREYKMYHN